MKVFTGVAPLSPEALKMMRADGGASPLAGTRFGERLRRCGRRLWRELRVALTPMSTPDRWVFIVGCYNSGTQLLMRLLDAHASVSSLPVEGQFLTDELPRPFELGLPRMWTARADLFRLTESDDGPDAVRLQREWIMRLDRSKAVYVEKSPTHSARTRWFQHHFHNAHFLALVRNGYAVAEGIRRKAEPLHRPEGWPISLCARQWARTYEILLEDAAHLDRLHWVRYESLASDTKDTVREILAFLQLVEDGSIDLSRTWRVHERDDPIRNMNSESLERLSNDDIEAINIEADAMLRRFGYGIR